MEPRSDGQLFSVVVMQQGALVTTEVLGPGQYVVGSAKTARIQLEGVSRIAFIVTFDGNEIHVEDAAGVGLVVNGQPTEQGILTRNDVITVGPYRVMAQVTSAGGQMSAAGGFATPLPTKPAAQRWAGTPHGSSSSATIIAAAPELAPTVGLRQPHAPPIPVRRKDESSPTSPGMPLYRTGPTHPR